MEQEITVHWLWLWFLGQPGISCDYAEALLAFQEMLFLFFKGMSGQLELELRGTMPPPGYDNWPSLPRAANQPILPN